MKPTVPFGLISLLGVRRQTAKSLSETALLEKAPSHGFSARRLVVSEAPEASCVLIARYDTTFHLGPKSQQEHRRLQKQRMPRQKTAAFYISRKTVPAQNKAKQISRSIEQACGNLGSDPIEDERACASSAQVADENAI
jgi:hypothetical protein